MSLLWGIRNWETDCVQNKVFVLAAVERASEAELFEAPE